MRLRLPLLVALPLCLAWSVGPGRARVAVYPIALNDLANQPAGPELPGRMQRLGDAVRSRLSSGCGYEVFALDSAAPPR